MALSTFAELKASIADWLNREDLTSAIPDFITLAEAKFNRTIRTIDMLNRETLSLDNNVDTAVAADWLETHTLLLNYDPPIRPEYVRPEDMLQLQVTERTGNPVAYTIYNGELFIYPTPSGSKTAQHLYYQKIAALSDSNTSNWLLTSHPDIYLFGSLLQAEPYLKNDERLMTWANMMSAAMEELHQASERAMRPRGGMHARKRTF